MSHLAHIVKLKGDLIAEGVSSPEQQIAIAQTTYVKALITVASGNKLDVDARVAFNKYVLSYWNETTPVNGLLVITAINNFYRDLANAINNVFVEDKIKLDVTGKVETPLNTKYTELESYRALIQTLVDDANQKLPQFTATNQLI